MQANYLEKLPEAVATALNHDFVFIISENLVQHYPARQWTDQEILNDLKRRFGVEGHFVQTENYRIVELPGVETVKIIVP